MAVLLRELFCVEQRERDLNCRIISKKIPLQYQKACAGGLLYTSLLIS
jgi:hypothetical protein